MYERIKLSYTSDHIPTGPTTSGLFGLGKTMANTERHFQRLFCLRRYYTQEMQKQKQTVKCCTLRGKAFQSFSDFIFKKQGRGAPLVTQWLRICLPIDIENRVTDTGRGEERVRCKERATWRLTIPYVRQIANGNLLSDLGNSNRGSGTTEKSGMGREAGGDMGVCTCG